MFNSYFCCLRGSCLVKHSLIKAFKNSPRIFGLDAFHSCGFKILDRIFVFYIIDWISVFFTVFIICWIQETGYFHFEFGLGLRVADQPVYYSDCLDHKVKKCQHTDIVSREQSHLLTEEYH